MAEFDMSFVDNNFTITMEEENDLDLDVLDNVSILYPVKHNELTHRDASDAHPVSAITGLSDIIDNQEGKIDQIQSQVEQCSSDMSVARETIQELSQAVEAQTDELVEHISNMEVHIAEGEREFWNNKTRAFRNASESLVLTSFG